MGAALQPGTVVAERYRIDSLIGEGGMGAVYLVQHVHTDEKLAMKVLHAQTLRDDTAVERFRREARAPARVQSEHVARVTDAGIAAELGGAPFYVMEYLRGKDLDTVLKDVGPLPPPTVVEYMRQTARALDKAHGMGIVHRDLKPENLFLTSREDGTPCIKLLDFGIAKLMDTMPRPMELKTQTGDVFGTPAFMSPEQTRGETDLVGPPADIWAFGLIAYKLLTGRDYWTAQVLAQLYVEVLSAPIVPPSTRGAPFGPAFDAWFQRCVARDLGERFPTAGEAVIALATALGVDLPRSSVASIAWMSYDPTVVEVGHKTQGWPPGTPPPVPEKTAAAAVAVAPPVGISEPPPQPPSSSKLPIFIGVAVVFLGVVIGAGVLALSFARTLADDAAAEGAAPSASAVAPAPAANTAAAATPSDARAEAPLVAPAPATADDPDHRHASATPTSTRGKISTSQTPGDDTPKAERAEKADKPEKTERAEKRGMSDDQRRRIESLQRLCDSGTVPPAECAAKRAAILRGSD